MLPYSEGDTSLSLLGVSGRECWGSQQILRELGQIGKYGGKNRLRVTMSRYFAHPHIQYLSGPPGWDNEPLLGPVRRAVHIARENK